MIDGIVYINLAHRKDRQKLITAELEKITSVCSNVHRLDACLEPLCGHLGCGKSHVKALEVAIANKWNSVLIVEDDIKFTAESNTVCQRLTEVFNASWDVILLGLGHHNIKPSGMIGLDKVITSTCAHGYIVRSHYYEPLLQNFRSAVVKMTKQLEEHAAACQKENKPVTKLNYCSAIDQEWFSLQRKDTFYVFSPQLGIQGNEIYSDNNCSIEHQKNIITTIV